MDPLTAAAIGGGSGILEGIFGFVKGQQQISQANAIAKANPFIPEEMPGSVTQATNLAAQNYTNGMPGMPAAKQQIAQNAGNAFSGVAKTASGSGDLIDAANKINTGTQDASLKLAMEAASYKSNALSGYQEALGNEAQWQDKLYKNNTLEPYLRAANTAASLLGAGNQNEFKGVDSALSGVQTGIEDYQTQQKTNAFTKGGGMNTNMLLSLLGGMGG